MIKMIISVKYSAVIRNSNLWTSKIALGLGLNILSSFNITGERVL